MGGSGGLNGRNRKLLLDCVLLCGSELLDRGHHQVPPETRTDPPAQNRHLRSDCEQSPDFSVQAFAAKMGEASGAIDKLNEFLDEVKPTSMAIVTWPKVAEILNTSMMEMMRNCTNIGGRFSSNKDAALMMVRTVSRHVSEVLPEKLNDAAQLVDDANAELVNPTSKCKVELELVTNDTVLKGLMDANAGISLVLTMRLGIFSFCCKSISQRIDS